MSDLEKDFGKVAKEINAKIKEAAKLMKEANKLAKKAGVTSLAGPDPYGYDEDEDGNPLSEEALDKLDEIACMINITPLFNELDKAGWRTSSIGC